LELQRPAGSLNKIMEATNHGEDIDGQGDFSLSKHVGPIAAFKCIRRFCEPWFRVPYE
jgi:hypothetical protein